MPPAEALALTRREDTSGEFRFFFRPMGRHVTIRLGTSDLLCLEKVFVTDEYDVPFTLAPKTIVDAGANIGMATLYFARRFPDATIVAIEPDPSNFDLLRRNVEGLPNVLPIRAAVWPVAGRVRIANPDVEKWMVTVTPDPGGGGPEVEAITMPQIAQRLGAPSLDLVKLDIEGAELDLFGDPDDRWLSSVDVLVVELHDRFRPGCAQAFYRAVTRRPFLQELRGENIFIRFVRPPATSDAGMPAMPSSAARQPSGWPRLARSRS